MDVQAVQAVTDAVRSVCSLHGAMAMTSPEVRLADGREPSEGLTVLASNGARLLLRDDLRLPFAVWLAKQAGDISTGMIVCCAWQDSPSCAVCSGIASSMKSDIKQLTDGHVMGRPKSQGRFESSKPSMLLRCGKHAQMPISLLKSPAAWHMDLP